MKREPLASTPLSKNNNQNQNQTMRRYRRPLVEIQPNRRYVWLDLDTFRDGSYDIGKEGQEQINKLLASHGIQQKCSKGGIYVKVPKEIAPDLALEMARIAHWYGTACCDHAARAKVKGNRAPLVGWIDSKGRPLNKISMNK
ncbi:MAG: hypothetical protein NVS9B9_29180 [Ktedonobacteraceae bacterium]